MDNTNAWIFVSHSSADIVKVRKVRNYLEEHNTAPLLFHLISLKEPEEFWPFIEREIAERNFFLLCDSENAQKSEWVAKERKAIKHFSSIKPIRVGRTNLDLPNIDYSGLQSFIKNIKAFYIGDPNLPVNSILTSFGYDVIGGVNFSKNGLERLGDGSQMSDDMLDTFRYSISQGWVLVALTAVLLDSDKFWEELPDPNKDRVMFIVPSGLIVRSEQRGIPSDRLIEILDTPENAIREAANKMLIGGLDKSVA